MNDWKKLEQELLRNPEVKAEYDALEPEFALANRIIQIRLQQNLTQQELAAKAGLKQSAVARLESGNSDARFSTVYRVGRALGKKVTLS